MDGLFRRRRLPHWDVEDATFFITACLEGSIPAQGWVRFRKFQERLDRQPRPVGLAEEEWEIRKHKQAFAEFDKILDFESAVSHFSDSRVAAEMESALRFFAGDRCQVLAFVVMPSHFHFVFHPRPEWVRSLALEPTSVKKSRRRSPRELIMQRIKGYSAHQCNQLLGLTERFWQQESYDHVVRGDDELGRIIEYVENNPVKAGLVTRPEDWQYSSAAVRLRLNLARGEAIPKVG